jgi:hypothetical protein
VSVEMQFSFWRTREEWNSLMLEALSKSDAMASRKRGTCRRPSSSR